MWMCHAGFSVGEKSCGWFTWAEFDENGRPSWADGYTGNANLPAVDGTQSKEEATVVAEEAVQSMT
jgi:hypothetical protein